MTVIKLLSSERNMLIRMLERYENYIKSDKKITDKYKEIELKDIRIIQERINDVIAPEIYPEAKPIEYDLDLKETRGRKHDR